jgi:uncharacterized protein (DUF305 family)
MSAGAMSAGAMSAGAMSAGAMSAGAMSAGAMAPATGSASGNNDQDVAFATDMIMHHRQAVEMATLATGRSTDAAVLALAAKIKAAQGPEITTMTAWMKTWGATMSKGMPGMDMSATMPGMMSDTELKGLKGLKGPAFDRKFLTLMIAHHQGAVTMAGTELKQGGSSAAKTLAEQITTDQTAEISQMHTMLG